MERFQYDDDGDFISHEDPIPDGGDGYFGRNVFLNSPVTGISDDGHVSMRPALDTWPNPFNPIVTISCSVTRGNPVRLTVYDILGRRVTVLLDEISDVSTRRITWDSTDEDGVPVTSGIYFIQLETGSYTVTKKTVLLR
jgi:hypothetical protein